MSTSAGPDADYEDEGWQPTEAEILARYEQQYDHTDCSVDGCPSCDPELQPPADAWISPPPPVPPMPPIAGVQ